MRACCSTVLQTPFRERGPTTDDSRSGGARILDLLIVSEALDRVTAIS